jgi:amino acid permease
MIRLVQGQPESQNLTHEDPIITKKDHLIVMLSALPSAYLAINCHPNYFEINPSRRDGKAVYSGTHRRKTLLTLTAAFITASILYLSIAIAGTSLYGERT